MKPATLWFRLHEALSESVNGASLAVFRICFGLALAWDMLKHVRPVGNTCLADLYYSQVGFHFTYPGFSWVKPLAAPWIHWHFLVAGIAGLLVAAGLFYRTAAFTLFVGYTWYFLLDQTWYNNHYYLMALLAFLMVWLPADRRLSLRWTRPSTDGLISFWPVFLIRAQFLIVYVYASIAKFNVDWLTGEPIIASGAALLEMLETWHLLPDSLEPIHISLMMAWTGLVFDLVIGFLLLVPRTRLLAVALLAVFHGLNQLLLPIGVFPFLAFTGSLIFLDPSWPDQLGSWIRSPRLIRPDWKWFGWGAVAVPGLGLFLGWRLPVDSSNHQRAASIPWWTTAFVTVWIGWQVLFPLRHFGIEGNASWTEEGQLFAWRMMLRQKGAGHVTLHVEDPALVKARETGGDRFHWDAAPESECRAIYIPIHGTQVRWEDHPGLNTVFEGLLGYRTFYVSKNESESEIKELATYWQDRTGRVVKPSRTVPLDEALARIADRLEHENVSQKDSKYPELAESIYAVRERVQHLPEGGDSREEALSATIDLLSHLVHRDKVGFVQQELMRIHPFSLIGADPGPIRIYVVDACENPGELRETFAGLGVPESYTVWCDFTRLRAYHWRKLPAWFPTHEQGTLKVVWNYFLELHPHQAEAMAVQPRMISQYSRELAHRWEAQSGRRPKVRAYTHVMMNYRFPHPLVDPTVDMASVDYSVWKHNEWILPLNAEKIQVADHLRRDRLKQR